MASKNLGRRTGGSNGAFLNRRWKCSLCGGLAVLVSLATTRPAVADPTPTTEAVPRDSTPTLPTAPPTEERGPGEPTRIALELERTPPPPSHIVYFQYGVAFSAEQVIAAGPICGDPRIPCVLGAGGGIVIRGGWRSSGPLYIGGAYELTKQDPNKLYRIALLQQARAEARYYVMTARVTEPYIAASAGVAGYGNEWTVDTWGPGGSIGGGLEYQVSRHTVIGLALAYRMLYFSRFTDTAGSVRDGGFAQLLGLDLVLEQRDAVLRAGSSGRSR